MSKRQEMFLRPKEVRLAKNIVFSNVSRVSQKSSVRESCSRINRLLDKIETNSIRYMKYSPLVILENRKSTYSPNSPHPRVLFLTNLEKIRKMLSFCASELSEVFKTPLIEKLFKQFDFLFESHTSFYEILQDEVKVITERERRLAEQEELLNMANDLLSRGAGEASESTKALSKSQKKSKLQKSLSDLSIASSPYSKPKYAADFASEDKKVSRTRNAFHQQMKLESMRKKDLEKKKKRAKRKAVYNLNHPGMEFDQFASLIPQEELNEIKIQKEKEFNVQVWNCVNAVNNPKKTEKQNELLETMFDPQIIVQVTRLVYDEMLAQKRENSEDLSRVILHLERYGGFESTSTKELKQLAREFRKSLTDDMGYHVTSKSEVFMEPEYLDEFLKNTQKEMMKKIQKNSNRIALMAINTYKTQVLLSSKNCSTQTTMHNQFLRQLFPVNPAVLDLTESSEEISSLRVLESPAPGGGGPAPQKGKLLASGESVPGSASESPRKRKKKKAKKRRGMSSFFSNGTPFKKLDFTQAKHLNYIQLQLQKYPKTPLLELIEQPITLQKRLRGMNDHLKQKASRIERMSEKLEDTVLDYESRLRELQLKNAELETKIKNMRRKMAGQENFIRSLESQNIDLEDKVSSSDQAEKFRHIHSLLWSVMDYLDSINNDIICCKRIGNKKGKGFLGEDPGGVQASYDLTNEQKMNKATQILERKRRLEKMQHEYVLLNKDSLKRFREALRRMSMHMHDAVNQKFELDNDSLQNSLHNGSHFYLVALDDYRSFTKYHVKGSIGLQNLRKSGYSFLTRVIEKMVVQGAFGGGEKHPEEGEDGGGGGSGESGGDAVAVGGAGKKSEKNQQKVVTTRRAKSESSTSEQKSTRKTPKHALPMELSKMLPKFRNSLRNGLLAAKKTSLLMLPAKKHKQKPRRSININMRPSPTNSSTKTPFRAPLPLDPDNQDSSDPENSDLNSRLSHSLALLMDEETREFDSAVANLALNVPADDDSGEEYDTNNAQSPLYSKRRKGRKGRKSRRLGQNMDSGASEADRQLQIKLSKTNLFDKKPSREIRRRKSTKLPDRGLSGLNQQNGRKGRPRLSVVHTSLKLGAKKAVPKAYNRPQKHTVSKRKIGAGKSNPVQELLKMNFERKNPKKISRKGGAGSVKRAIGHKSSKSMSIRKSQSRKRLVNKSQDLAKNDPKRASKGPNNLEESLAGTLAAQKLVTIKETKESPQHETFTKRLKQIEKDSVSNLNLADFAYQPAREDDETPFEIRGSKISDLDLSLSRSYIGGTGGRGVYSKRSKSKISEEKDRSKSRVALIDKELSEKKILEEDEPELRSPPVASPSSQVRARRRKKPKMVDKSTQILTKYDEKRNRLNHKLRKATTSVNSSGTAKRVNLSKKKTLGTPVSGLGNRSRLDSSGMQIYGERVYEGGKEVDGGGDSTQEYLKKLVSQQVENGKNGEFGRRMPRSEASKRSKGGVGGRFVEQSHQSGVHSLGGGDSPKKTSTERLRQIRRGDVSPGEESTQKHLEEHPRSSTPQKNTKKEPKTQNQPKPEKAKKGNVLLDLSKLSGEKGPIQIEDGAGTAPENQLIAISELLDKLLLDYQQGHQAAVSVVNFLEFIYENGAQSIEEQEHMDQELLLKKQQEEALPKFYSPLRSKTRKNISESERRFLKEQTDANRLAVVQEQLMKLLSKLTEVLGLSKRFLMQEDFQRYLDDYESPLQRLGLSFFCLKEFLISKIEDMSEFQNLALSTKRHRYMHEMGIIRTRRQHHDQRHPPGKARRNHSDPNLNKSRFRAYYYNSRYNRPEESDGELRRNRGKVNGMESTHELGSSYNTRNSSKTKLPSPNASGGLGDGGYPVKDSVHSEEGLESDREPSTPPAKVTQLKNQTFGRRPYNRDVKVVRTTVESFVDKKDLFDPLAEENLKNPLFLVEKIVENMEAKMFVFNQGAASRSPAHRRNHPNLGSRHQENPKNRPYGQFAKKRNSEPDLDFARSEAARKRARFMMLAKRELRNYLALHNVKIADSLVFDLKRNEGIKDPYMRQMKLEGLYSSPDPQVRVRIGLGDDVCERLVRFYKRLVWLYQQVQKEKGEPLPMKKITFQDSLEVIKRENFKKKKNLRIFE